MRKIKKLIVVSIASLFSLVSNMSFAEEFNKQGSVTIASQYLWRGFDLSNQELALQGDFIVEYQSGFWIGAWGSTYKVVIDETKDDGVEVDYIGGYNYAVNESFTLGAGFTEYTYTGDAKSSTEFFVQVAVNQFTFSYYQDIDLDATYITLDAEFKLNEKITLNLHAGDYSLEQGGNNNEYYVALNYAFTDKFSLTGLYSDNSLDINGAEDSFVVSMSYSF